jgi:hypothetical protein
MNVLISMNIENNDDNTTNISTLFLTVTFWMLPLVALEILILIKRDLHRTSILFKVSKLL